MNTRTYPHDLAAERDVLGAILEAADTEGMAEELLDGLLRAGLEARDFYRPQHGALFGLMVESIDEGRLIDRARIVEHIARSRAEAVYGGLAYVIELCAPMARAMSAAECIMADAQRRRAAELYQDAAARALDGLTDPAALADEVLGSLLEDGRNAHGADEWATMDGVIEGVAERCREVAKRPGSSRGISTGLRQIDGIVGGLHPAEYVVLAARPAMGKTALALNIAENVAGQGHHVAVFSLEMTRDQLGARTMAAAAGIDSRVLRQGVATADDGRRLVERVDDATPRLAKRLRTLHVCERSLTAGGVRAALRRLRRRVGHVPLVVVDYLQLMLEERGGSSNRESEVAAMSGTLKAISKETGCTVLVLAQLNRQCEQRVNKRPVLSDLRESGAVEQDADVCMFLYRDVYYKSGEEVQAIERDYERVQRGESVPGRTVEEVEKDKVRLTEAECIVAKNRHGATGTAWLDFRASHTRFMDGAAREEGEHEG